MPVIIIKVVVVKVVVVVVVEGIQQAADTGNIKRMYDGIKKAVGPTIQKTAPMKSKARDLINKKTEQLDR